MRATRHGPLITPETHPAAGTNINGPALVEVPDSVPGRLGRFHLYFADHKGSSIRLAHAEHVTGPYVLHGPGSLDLARSGFPTEPPTAVGPASGVQAAAIEAEGHDAHFTPHIASPDVVVDHGTGTIWMAYHGLCPDGSQLTRMAESTDGVTFTAHEPLVAFPYLRILPTRWQGRWLAMSMPGITYRSDDLRTWEPGPMLFDADFRHCALLRRGSTLHVLWTRVGDAPEHILHSTVDVGGDWSRWAPSEPESVLTPEEPWEGAHLPVAPSVRGQVTTPVHQLRDPALCEVDGRTWMAYAVAGESGIALAELHDL